VRPPSAAWADLKLEPMHLINPAKFGELRACLPRAAPGIRHLHVGLIYPPCTVPVAEIVALAAPFMESCTLPLLDNDHDFRSSATFVNVIDVLDAMASASRLTRLSFYGAFQEIRQQIVAPGRLPGDAWATAATLAWISLSTDRSRFHSACGIARAAAPAAQLAKACGLMFPRTVRQGAQSESLAAFADVAQQGLTHLSCSTCDGPMRPDVIALLNNLRLAELDIYLYRESSHVVPRGEGLTALTNPSLTRLTVSAELEPLNPDVHLSGVVMARLRDLTLMGLASPDLPDALRVRRGALFTSLTRLKYGYFYDTSPSNLGPLSDPDLFCIPTLVDLTVLGYAFTLGDGRDGRAWAMGVARASLPSLAVFRLQYACRNDLLNPQQLVPDRWVQDRCLGCGEEGGCACGREVRDAVFEHLPAAYAAAGRALRLDLMRGAALGAYFRVFQVFELHFEAARRRR